MKYITPIKFPKFDLELPKPQIKPVTYTDPSSILRTLGVPKYDYFDLQCLEALVKPQHSLEIHKDLDSSGLPGCAWSLVFCPNGNDNCFLEIYEETPETKLLTFNSVMILSFKLESLLLSCVIFWPFFILLILNI